MDGLRRRHALHDLGRRAPDRRGEDDGRVLRCGPLDPVVGSGSVGDGDAVVGDHADRRRRHGLRERPRVGAVLLRAAVRDGRVVRVVRADVPQEPGADGLRVLGAQVLAVDARADERCVLVVALPRVLGRALRARGRVLVDDGHGHHRDGVGDGIDHDGLHRDRRHWRRRVDRRQADGDHRARHRRVPRRAARRHRGGAVADGRGARARRRRQAQRRRGARCVLELRAGLRRREHEGLVLGRQVQPVERAVRHVLPVLELLRLRPVAGAEHPHEQVAGCVAARVADVRVHQGAAATRRAAARRVVVPAPIGRRRAAALRPCARGSRRGVAGRIARTIRRCTATARRGERAAQDGDARGRGGRRARRCRGSRLSRCRATRGEGAQGRSRRAVRQRT